MNRSGRQIIRGSNFRITPRKRQEKKEARWGVGVGIIGDRRTDQHEIIVDFVVDKLKHIYTRMASSRRRLSARVAARLIDVTVHHGRRRVSISWHRALVHTRLLVHHTYIPRGRDGVVFVERTARQGSSPTQANKTIAWSHPFSARSPLVEVE